MNISIHAISVELFINGLTSLGDILRRSEAYAQTHNIGAGVLESWRLAPDMADLAGQVQLACDFAEDSTARLLGAAEPEFPDDERTFPELIARVERSLAYLQAVDPAALERAGERPITAPLRTRELVFDRLTFVQKWALPNFFFHLTTAYDLLRNGGVDVRKPHYLGMSERPVVARRS